MKPMANLTAHITLLMFVITVVDSQSAKSTEQLIAGKNPTDSTHIARGTVFSFEHQSLAIYPGTTRTITVYIPAQYEGKKPACVYVGLDALLFEAPKVFDKLIHNGEMPVTIAIGVSPGTVASSQPTEKPRYNRSHEFDGLNDSFARFLITEIFPAVEQRKTPEGLPILLSKNPNDRCAAGASTGGICAFTLAWERPDQFRRVYSAIGTFVGMRGGDRYPVLVRKTEPKPIRIFLQDGENDQWMGGPEVGDWWMSNVTLQRSLDFAGYDHNYEWGQGAHDLEHPTAVFPEAMRFIWKDWPKPLEAQISKSQNVTLKRCLDLSSSWERVPGTGNACDQLVGKHNGEVFFKDKIKKTVIKIRLDNTITTNQIPLFEKVFCFGKHGEIIQSEKLNANCLTMTHADRIYALEEGTGSLWLIEPDGTHTELDNELDSPAALAISPDGSWLNVMEKDSHWGYTYRLKKDGTTEYKQRFFWAHAPDWAQGSGASQLCYDRSGYAYLASFMGIQIFDHNGRSRAILTMPQPVSSASSVCFGGKDMNVLYAISDGKLYRRKMKNAGVHTIQEPMRIPDQGPG